MKIAYVIWRDATHGTDEIAAEDADLAELHEIGFIVAETDEAITLNMEHQEDATKYRLWLTIPRVNVTSIAYYEIKNGAIKRPRTPRPRPTTQSNTEDK